jgi:hypothetical protein
MHKSERGFNESHPLGSVIKDGLVVGNLPARPEEIDLRFLTMIGLGDTYNGGDDPSDGMSYQAVLYGNQIAWEQWAEYLMCSCEQRGHEGNDLYRKMYFVSRLYQKIQAIGRAKYFREKLKKEADTFYMSGGDLAVLKDHPQFKDVVESIGISIVPVKMRENYFTVQVSKFYDKK